MSPEAANLILKKVWELSTANTGDTFVVKSSREQWSILCRENQTGRCSDKTLTGWFGIVKSKRPGKLRTVITETFLVFIPYWRIRADGFGFLVRKKTSTSKRQNNDLLCRYRKKNPAVIWKNLLCMRRQWNFELKNKSLRGYNNSVDFESLQRDGMIFNVIASEKEAFDLQ